MESSDCFILVCFGGRPYIPYIRKDSESSCHDVSDWWNFADSAGNGIYQIMNSMLQNDRVMTGYYLTQTIEIAGAIALAIFLMDTLFKVIRRGDWKQDSLRYTRQDGGKEEKR